MVCGKHIRLAWLRWKANLGPLDNGHNLGLGLLEAHATSYQGPNWTREGKTVHPGLLPLKMLAPSISYPWPCFCSHLLCVPMLGSRLPTPSFLPHPWNSMEQKINPQISSPHGENPPPVCLLSWGLAHPQEHSFPVPQDAELGGGTGFFLPQQWHFWTKSSPLTCNNLELSDSGHHRITISSSSFVIRWPSNHQPTLLNVFSRLLSSQEPRA